MPFTALEEIRIFDHLELRVVAHAGWFICVFKQVCSIDFPFSWFEVLVPHNAS